MDEKERKLRTLLKDERLSQLSLNLLLNDSIRAGEPEFFFRLLLLDGRADPTIDENSLIRRASSFNMINILRLLLIDGRANPSEISYGRNALSLACWKGHGDVVRLLLNDGRADPNDIDNDPIRLACSMGHDNVVRLLLHDGRADPSAHNNFPIRYAFRNGHRNIFFMLLQTGKVNLSDFTDEDINEAYKNAYHGGAGAATGAAAEVAHVNKKQVFLELMNVIVNTLLNKNFTRDNTEYDILFNGISYLNESTSLDHFVSLFNQIKTSTLKGNDNVDMLDAAVPGLRDRATEIKDPAFREQLENRAAVNEPTGLDILAGKGKKKKHKRKSIKNKKSKRRITIK